DDGPHFIELWKTDGTADGTVMVKDILPGDHSSGLHSLTNIDDTLFFAAANGQGPGLELWQSDGTAECTTLVADINPSGSSAPRYLIVVNKHLVFEANDGTHGWELFTAPLSDFQYPAVEDTLLTVDAPHGLLTQATGLPGNPVSASLDTAPFHGTVD